MMKMTTGLLLLVFGLLAIIISIAGILSGFPLVKSLVEFLVMGIMMVIGGSVIAWQALSGDVL